MSGKWCSYLLSAVVVLGLASCGGTENASETTEVEPQEVTIIPSVPFTGLDPHGVNGQSFWSLAVNFGNVSEALTQLNGQDATVRPALAKSWEWLDDEKTRLRLELQEGVKFQDGEAFSADVAAKNIERVLDPKMKSAIVDWVKSVKDLRAVDPATLEITTKYPDPRLPSNLTAVMMLSPAQLEPKEITGPVIGTGPYAIERQTAGALLLTQNPDYWGDTPETAPQQVTLRPIEEAGARVSAVESGEAAIAFGIPSELVERVPKVVVEPQLEVMTWRVDAQAGVTKDLRVRKALVIGTNMEEIRKTIVGEKYSGACSSNFSPPGVQGWNPALKDPPPYDPAEAKRLLTEAGAMGKTITFVTAERYPKGVEASQALAQQIEQLGLKVKYSLRDLPGWLKIIYNEGASSMLLLGGGAEQWDAVTLLAKSVAGPTSRYPVDQLPELQRIVAKAQMTADESERDALAHEALKQVADSYNIMCGWIPSAIYGAQDNVSWTVRRDNTIPLSSIKVG